MILRYQVPVDGPVSHTPPVHVLPCRDPEGNGFYVYELDR